MIASKCIRNGLGNQKLEEDWLELIPDMLQEPWVSELPDGRRGNRVSASCRDPGRDLFRIP